MFGLRLPELLIIFFILFVVLLPLILFLRTMSSTLRLTAGHHTATPGSTWLMLVPIFSLGWQFYLVNSATKGIKGKFKQMAMDPGDAGYGVGLATCVLICVASVAQILLREDAGETIAAIAGLSSVVTAIIYLVKLHGFNKAMAAAAVPPYPPIMAG